jgi:hypothetical protein
MSTLSKIFIALIVIALVPFGMLWVARTVVTKSYTVDYGTEDAADVYKQIFGCSPPAGMKSVKAYGHGGIGTTSVWLHVEGSDEALDRMRAFAITVAPSLFHFAMPGGVDNLNTTLIDDARAAEWDQVPNIAKPRYFSFIKNCPDGQWSGDIVLDSANHQAFIRAQLLTRNTK